MTYRAIESLWYPVYITTKHKGTGVISPPTASAHQYSIVCCVYLEYEDVFFQI